VTYASCPTAVVDAPVEVVWSLLTDPAHWGDFYDVRAVVVDPPGPASVGQVVSARSGPRGLGLGVSFRFTLIDPVRFRFCLEARLPMGMTVAEDMNCMAIDADHCRVAYNCTFGFAPGWRGALARRLLGRELRSGPVDSLRRLKAAAERRHAPRS
jgi:hypothetical protein